MPVGHLQATAEWPDSWPSPGYQPSVHRNVLDRARIAVKDHFVREPVNYLVPVIVDVGIADVYRAQVLGLGQKEGRVLKSIQLGHFLVGLVFLDLHVSLLGVLDVYTGDFSVFDFYRNGMVAFFVDHVVSIGFDFVAKQLLSVVMMCLLCRGNRGSTGGEHAANDDESGEKTPCMVHGSVSGCERVAAEIPLCESALDNVCLDKAMHPSVAGLCDDARRGLIMRPPAWGGRSAAHLAPMSRRFQQVLVTRLS